MLVKSTLICCIGLMVAIPGMLKSGLAAPVPGWGFAVSLYLASVIFNEWVGRMVAVLIPLTLIAAAYGFTAGHLQYAYDIGQHATHPVASSNASPSLTRMARSLSSSAIRSGIARKDGCLSMYSLV